MPPSPAATRGFFVAWIDVAKRPRHAGFGRFQPGIAPGLELRLRCVLLRMLQATAGLAVA